MADRKKSIDGLCFTVGMMLFNPATGVSKTPDELNEDDRYTYDACMGAIELLKALDVTPEELERLKMCRAECKIDCLLEHYNKVKDELDAMKKAQEPITGETSDGYHTFNELYHHRAVLFSVIVANYPDRAWKSKKHHDGTMYDDMFIVGIDTPDGQATYHYDVDPYWDMFKCRVLDNAPEWDGHTPAQAIERIGKLKAQEPVKPVVDIDTWKCRNCGHVLEHQQLLGDNVLFHEQYNYCPECGRAVKWE